MSFDFKEMESNIKFLTEREKARDSIVNELRFYLDNIQSYKLSTQDRDFLESLLRPHM